MVAQPETEGFLAVCVVCGRQHMGYRLTCSKACHDILIESLVKRFGEYKKVVDTQTGKAYKVPTRYIAERGLKHSELKNFPEWSE